MEPSRLEALGVTALPDSLACSLDRFEADQVFSEAMGEELFSSYVGIKRDEVELFAEMSLEDEIETLLERH